VRFILNRKKKYQIIFTSYCWFKKMQYLCSAFGKKQWTKITYISSYSALLFSCKTSRSEFGM